MNFAPDEKTRMARLRREASSTTKEALITALDRAIVEGGAKALAGAAKGVGTGAWRSAKYLGGGSNLKAVGVLGAGAYSASHIPNIIRQGRRAGIEAMTPYSDQKSMGLLV